MLDVTVTPPLATCLVLACGPWAVRLRMCGEISYILFFNYFCFFLRFHCAIVGVSFQGQTSMVGLRILPMAPPPPPSLSSTKMRALGALVAIHRLLVSSAFISPISNVLRSNPAFQTADRCVSSNPAARRLQLPATPDAQGGDGDDRSVALRSGNPVLSFPGGGIFFWVSLRMKWQKLLQSLY